MRGTSRVSVVTRGWSRAAAVESTEAREAPPRDPAYAAAVAAQTNRRRLIPLLVALVAIAVVWVMPDIDTGPVDSGPSASAAWRAVIVDPAPPTDPDDPLSQGNDVVIEFSEGPRAGEEALARVTILTGNAAAQGMEAGDEVVVSITEGFDGSEIVAVSEPYRLPALGLLLLVFGLVMILVGGWQGLRALVGLGLTVILVAKFFIPLLLSGIPPVPLAIALALVVTSATIVLTEGLTRVGVVAIAGTFGGLVITALLAGLLSGAVAFSDLTVGQVAYFTTSTGEPLDVSGILLAAIILGAVGVLDDVTVTQAATVDEFSIRHPQPPIILWRRATRVGRSHIAATTNTLFMAYVGASLPALIFFVVVAEPALLTLNRELLALEVVRTLVGSIGIVLAMPLTTAIAAWVFGRRSTEEAARGG